MRTKKEIEEDAKPLFTAEEGHILSKLIKKMPVFSISAIEKRESLKDKIMDNSETLQFDKHLNAKGCNVNRTDNR